MTRETAIVGGMVWTATNGATAETATILIEENQITAIDTSQSIELPAGAHVISAEGCTVLPGLIDMHVHLSTNSNYSVVVDNSGFLADTPLPAKAFHSFRNSLYALRAGFTSLRVMGHREPARWSCATSSTRGFFWGLG